MANISHVKIFTFPRNVTDSERTPSGVNDIFIVVFFAFYKYLLDVKENKHV